MMNVSIQDALALCLPSWVLDPTGQYAQRELAATAAPLQDAWTNSLTLYEEQDPASAFATFDRWQAVNGLPDQCTPDGLTLSQQRDRLLTKIASPGGQSAAYMVQVAARLGFTITITQFDAHTVASAVDEPLAGMDWRYRWQVNAVAAGITFSTVSDPVDTPLATGAANPLECVLNQIRPAHTQITFIYS
jgi:uncharacterized protein YmfQ (DUF2313 family)